jgi:hypothetical protein
MSRFERTGHRDLTFSAWHRTLRDDLHYMDLDYVGFCHKCRVILCVAEICFDNGQYKPTTVTRNAAEGLGVPGLLIRYQTDSTGVLTGFSVRRIWPDPNGFSTVEPAVLERWIEKQHDDHVCGD